MPSSRRDDGEEPPRTPGRDRRASSEWDALEEEAYWEAREQDEREQAERDEAEQREAAVEAMVEWFHEQFEDPQIETPYDSEDGRYVYPWGGPFEAGDVLHGAFGHEYPEPWIIEAVDDVQKGDIYEWAPKAGGDYYDVPEPDEDEPEELTRPLLTSRILERLEQVERQLDELPTNLGHNQPPGDVGVPPYTDEDEKAVRHAVSLVRVEVTSAAPNERTLVEATSRLKTIGAKIGLWVGKKLDLVVDESIKYGVPLLAFSQFYGSISKLVQDIQLFILNFVEKL